MNLCLHDHHSRGDTLGISGGVPGSPPSCLAQARGRSSAWLPSGGMGTGPCCPALPPPLQTPFCNYTPAAMCPAAIWPPSAPFIHFMVHQDEFEGKNPKTHLQKLSHLHISADEGAAPLCAYLCTSLGQPGGTWPPLHHPPYKHLQKIKKESEEDGKTSEGCEVCGGR